MSTGRSNDFMNQFVMWALGILATLVIGAYGFAASSATDVDKRVTNRLERIEDKIDRLVERSIRQ